MATAFMYGNFLKLALSTNPVNWSSGTSDTFKVLLTTSAYSPNQDTDDFKNDVTANEVANGNGYTTGGQAIVSPTIAYAGTGNKVTLDAADTTWTSSTITARYAVIYKDTGTASTSPLLGYVDFTTDQSSSSGNFTITWNASGIFEITVA